MKPAVGVTLSNSRWLHFLQRTVTLIGGAALEQETDTFSIRHPPYTH